MFSQSFREQSFVAFIDLIGKKKQFLLQINQKLDYQREKSAMRLEIQVQKIVFHMKETKD